MKQDFVSKQDMKCRLTNWLRPYFPPPLWSRYLQEKRESKSKQNILSVQEARKKKKKEQDLGVQGDSCLVFESFKGKCWSHLAQILCEDSQEHANISPYMVYDGINDARTWVNAWLS